MARSRYFTGKTFAFLRDLARNNDRVWFKANKDRYEEDVREPALRFISDFGHPLREISPHFKADPRANGGSLFRIHRDIRFSRDKSPYKTSTGIQFRHDQGKDAHAPGFYLHLEPGSCFVGLGIWRPDGKTLRRIREGLVEDPGGWEAAVGDATFAERFELGGDSLVRGPRGFDADHPLIEDLKRKDFVAMAPLTEARVTRDGFMEDFAEACRGGRPFVAYLCRVLGLPF